jgi:hypothetical protein
MIYFVEGMLVGLALGVVIQIVIPHLKGKSFKLKKETPKEDVLVTAKDKWDKICKEYEEDKDMEYIDSVIDFCKGK